MNLKTPIIRTKNNNSSCLYLWQVSKIFSGNGLQFPYQVSCLPKMQQKSSWRWIYCYEYWWSILPKLLWSRKYILKSKVSTSIFAVKRKYHILSRLKNAASAVKQSKLVFCVLLVRFIIQSVSNARTVNAFWMVSLLLRIPKKEPIASLATRSK